MVSLHFLSPPERDLTAFGLLFLSVQNGRSQGTYGYNEKGEIATRKESA